MAKDAKSGTQFIQSLIFNSHPHFSCGQMAQVDLLVAIVNHTQIVNTIKHTNLMDNLTPHSLN